MKRKNNNSILIFFVLLILSCEGQTVDKSDEFQKKWNDFTISYIVENYGDKIDNRLCESTFPNDNSFWDYINSNISFRKTILAFLKKENLLDNKNAISVYEDYSITPKSKGKYHKSAWIKSKNEYFKLTLSAEDGDFVIEPLNGKEYENIFTLEEKDIINEELTGICKPEKIVILSELKNNKLALFVKIKSCWMVDLGGNDPYNGK